MPDNKQPWDNIYSDKMGTPLATPSVDYLRQSKAAETIAGNERVKYGLGKPVRISIIGDIKHDSD